MSTLLLLHSVIMVKAEIQSVKILVVLKNRSQACLLRLNQSDSNDHLKSAVMELADYMQVQ